jgi:hypothetical protein
MLFVSSVSTSFFRQNLAFQPHEASRNVGLHQLHGCEANRSCSGSSVRTRPPRTPDQAVTKQAKGFPGALSFALLPVPRVANAIQLSGFREIAVVLVCGFRQECSLRGSAFAPRSRHVNPEAGKVRLANSPPIDFLGDPRPYRGRAWGVAFARKGFACDLESKEGRPRNLPFSPLARASCCNRWTWPFAVDVEAGSRWNMQRPTTTLGKSHVNKAPQVRSTSSAEESRTGCSRVGVPSEMAT